MLKEAKAEMLKLKEKNLKNVFFFFHKVKWLCNQSRLYLKLWYSIANSIIFARKLSTEYGCY